jgi:hypothetical protein
VAVRRRWPWGEEPADEQSRQELAERRASMERFVRLRQIHPDDSEAARFVKAFDALVAGTEDDDVKFVAAAEVAFDRLGRREAVEQFIRHSAEDKARWRRPVL